MEMEYRVLDKGFVRLVEAMGDDSAVVLAARVSHGGGLKGEAQDRKLIHYLMRHHHETPFEHAVFKFHIKCPLFVARQWMRHRWASYNEISARYVEVLDEFYVPQRLRVQAEGDKQASEPTPEPLPDEPELIALIEQTHRQVYAAYRRLLEAGVARELARSVLPTGMYTQFYWTVNARSLMNFINLRADVNAQWEIRQYAEALAKVFQQRMPWTFEAFLKYVWSGQNEALEALANRPEGA